MDNMAAGHRVDLLQGEPLVLLERAVYVPAHKALLLSDVHLGKAETFQMAGIPIAQQVNEETLERLRSQCDQVQPQQIFILGDLFHSRQGLVEDVITAWSTFLSDTSAQVTLIIGNHDRAALDPVFDMDYSSDPISLGKLLLSHEPASSDLLPKNHLNICGHVHPVVHLQGAIDSLRFPCFYHEHEPQRLTLPSFGSFTGGHEVSIGTGRTAYITLEGGLMVLDSPPKED
ncbi:ligase-associated DNA damage response endonuclease PdeM [Leptolyngbya cf. ectocarpi LEGE 11479]|uniref:Ligase-associated DNA damage response endonuclease PdeM n=1 Tax=Leptolyngbya cf. ectocarpi LEGE 11479 TaxID=1828722 RepID=A0A928ZTW1_LEPEC|nr:ligase-associated DNA damage response endonuclease PdeM [Leptolyngbya ectocarpi]MBE9067366.1 ligase-associated DNA damage response endonuclease PdeM [Leptolyngbya cf. ectocarpi LEGE 11479]